MNVKQVLCLILICIGSITLIIGILGIFGSSMIEGVNNWAITIIGLIFFPAGIGLMKTTKGEVSNN